MGILVFNSEILVPKLVLQVRYLLGFVQQFVCHIFRHLGLANLIEPDAGWADSTVQQSKFRPLTAMLIKGSLGVVKFEELRGDGRPEGCVVCLDEFDDGEEIRRLFVCRHVFHRRCLDRWIDCDRRTCPLCRTPLVVREMEKGAKPAAFCNGD